MLPGFSDVVEEEISHAIGLEIQQTKAASVSPKEESLLEGIGVSSNVFLSTGLFSLY